MPVQLSEGNAQYLPIAANGTTTVSAEGPASIPANQPPGAVYGFEVNAIGTAWVVTAVDIVVQQTGTGSTTTTNTLFTGTASAPGQMIGPAPLGIRYRGTLAVITSGTAAGAGNLLWD